MSHNAAIENEEEQNSSRALLIYGVGGLALAAGTFLLLRYLINRLKENVQQNKSLEEGNSATYAKQLKMAFENDGWWGTNVPGVRRVFQEIPTKESFEAVRKSYQKLYHANLVRDLTDELTASEYNEMISIISSKPTNKEIQSGETQEKLLQRATLLWAKRLHEAVNYSFMGVPGTDEDAIRAVFLEIPSQRAYRLTVESYQKLYGISLAADLAHDLEFWEISDFMKIIKSKPQ